MSFNIKKSLEVDYLAARIISSRDYNTNVDASAGYILTAMADGKAQWQPNTAVTSFQTITLPDISYSTISAANTSSLYGFQLQVSDPLTLNVVSSLNRIIIGANFSGAGVSVSTLTSTVEGLGTAGYVSTSGLTSTTKGLRDYISTFIDPTELTSTVVGLGTSQYVSSIGLDAKLASTVAGLGQIYISIPSLISTVEGLGQIYKSSIDASGTISLVSTVAGLGNIYISIPSLISTVEGLGQTYISSLVQGNNILITGTAPTQNVGLNPAMTAINSIEFNNGGVIDLSCGDLNNVSYINLIDYGSIYFDSSGGVISFDMGTQNMADKRIDMAYGEIVNVGRMTLNGESYIQFGHSMIGGGSNAYIDMNKGSIRNISTTWTSTLYADTINYNTLNPPINISLDLTSTVAGLGTAGYVSTQSLTSTVAGLGQRYISLPSLISTVEGLGQIYKSSIDASGTINLVSTVAGLGQIYVSTPSLTSTVEGLGQTYVSTPSLTSTVQGLGQTYVSIPSLISTVQGLGQIYVSIPSLTSTVQGLGQSYVSIPSLTSTVQGLGQNYISIPSLTSTVEGLGQNYVSIPSLTSTLQGLGQTYVSIPSLTSTVKGLQEYVSTSFIDPTELTSTTAGLGTLGYISTQGLNISLTSTVQGLGTAGYISNLSLYSTVKGLEEYVSSGFIDPLELTSTVVGLGTAQYVSTIGLDAKLASTVAGLGTVGYVSTLGLTSTVTGLGTAGYISSQTLTYNLENLASMFGPKYSYVSNATLSAAMLAVKDEIIGGATGAYLTLTKISTILGDASGANVVTRLLSSIYEVNVGLSTVALIMQGQIDDLSGNINQDFYDLSNAVYTNFVQYPYLNNSLASTVAGLGSANYISSLSLTSTVAGLGTVGYVSTDGLRASLTSTVEGLGQTYVSIPSLTSTVTKLIELINTSVATADISGSLTSTVAGLGSAGYISTPSLTSTVVGLTIAQTSTLNSWFPSTVTGLGQNYVSIPSLTSTVTGLGSAGYVSTQSLTSTVAGLGENYVSIPSLTSTVIGLGSAGYVSSLSLTSTVAGLGQNYISTPSLTSTVAGLGRIYVSTPSLTSTVAGLGQKYISIESLVSTVANLQSAIPQIDLSGPFTSTVAGLGQIYVSTPSLTSTVVGLGSIGYVSTQSLTSTVVGLTNAQTSTLSSWFPSTVSGLGSAGYLSTLSLTSTVAGLGTAGYASTTGLTANYYTYVTAAGGPISGTSNFRVETTTAGTAAPVQHPVLNTWAEDVLTLGTLTAGDNCNINCLYNNYTFKTPASGSITLTISGESTSNIPPGKVFGINLWMSNGGATAATVSYVTRNTAGALVTVRWPGGTQPTLSGGLDKVDVFNLVTYDRGNNWFGFVAGKNY